MDEINYDLKEKYIFSTIIELILSAFSLVWLLWPLYSINNHLLPAYMIPLEISKLNFSINYFEFNNLIDIKLGNSKNSIIFNLFGAIYKFI